MKAVMIIIKFNFSIIIATNKLQSRFWDHSRKTAVALVKPQKYYPASQPCKSVLLEFIIVINIVTEK